MEKIFVVIGEGEVVFSSRDAEYAESYCDERNYQAIAEALEEIGFDSEDPDPEHRDQAEIYAGQNGDILWVGEAEVDFEADPETEVTVTCDVDEAFVTVDEILSRLHDGEEDDEEFGGW